jgi:uncharacterized protein DUF2735
MSNSPPRESAKIIQFPARGRRMVDDQATGMQPFAVNDASRMAPAAFCDSWYHDEAVQDVRRTLKH